MQSQGRTRLSAFRKLKLLRDALHGVKGKRNAKPATCACAAEAGGDWQECGARRLHTVCGLRWQESQSMGSDDRLLTSQEGTNDMTGEGRGRVQATHTPDGVI